MPLTDAERQARQREKKKYLADAERGARLAFASLKGPDNQGTEKERVERALKYANWRWDGFHAGEVSSL